MKTFQELRTEGKRLYQQITAKRQETDKAVDDLKKKVLPDKVYTKVYTDAYIARRQKEFDEDFRKVRDVASLEFYGMVRETVEGKRSALEAMLATAPTAEQMNLLNALQMQGAALDAGEAQAVAAQLMGNYRALHALQVMCDKAGIKLHFPAEYDYQQLTEALDRMEKYLLDRHRDMENFTNYRTMSFDSRVFFDAWSDDAEHPDGIFGPMAEILDGNRQTVPAPTAGA